MALGVGERTMKYDVAHIREQGQDMIIVLVSHEPTEVQQSQLQRCATAAGLAGTVVPVWTDPFGHLHFRAPVLWHGFFESLSPEFINANINRTLTCG